MKRMKNIVVLALSTALWVSCGGSREGTDGADGEGKVGSVQSAITTCGPTPPGCPSEYVYKTRVWANDSYWVEMHDCRLRTPRICANGVPMTIDCSYHYDTTNPSYNDYIGDGCWVDDQQPCQHDLTTCPSGYLHHDIWAGVDMCYSEPGVAATCPSDKHLENDQCVLNAGAACCGNGTCEPAGGEDSTTCPGDCPACNQGTYQVNGGYSMTLNTVNGVYSSPRNIAVTMNCSTTNHQWTLTSGSCPGWWQTTNNMYCTLPAGGSATWSLVTAGYPNRTITFY